MSDLKFIKDFSDNVLAEVKKGTERKKKWDSDEIIVMVRLAMEDTLLKMIGWR